MNTSFSAFIKKIKLTDLQKEDAKTKIKSVCEKLHAKYYPNQAYDGTTKLLIGSYGKHTNIRPPQDIDLLFKMPDSEFERYDTLAGNKQSQLLQDIREILKEKFTTTERISAWGKVIVINFSEGSHTVELLPAWQLSSGTFKIPNSENGGSWDIWNPVAETENVSISNTQTGETKTLVRMLKCWVRNGSVPIQSFVLEILVVNYLKEKFNNIVVGVSYSELVSGFFDFLKSKRNSSVFSVGTGTFISLGEEWFSRADSAYSRAQKAIQYEQEDQLYNASLEWRKIFGDDFLVAEDKIFVDSLRDKISELTKSFPSAREENITTDYGIEVRLVNGYEVVIDAEVTQNGFRTGWLTDFLKKHFPLLKGKRLKFRVKKLNVPSPYYVMWKVRNFGEEARGADGLRGEITRDVGYNTKEEHTLYHGEHYVECYVIKDSTCVAIGKVLVPIGTSYD